MFFKAWKQIAGGKTLMRALMNLELTKHALERGAVLDIGGGKNPSYFSYLRGASQAAVFNLDKQHGKGAQKDIDFEKDELPYEDETIDQILMLNVLEHVYRHGFLMGEAFRVLKKGKTLIGFVPFLINYHPDPQDYFRYTDEALRKIFTEAGFAQIDIRTIGGGPFAVHFNNLTSFFPRYLNTLLWPHFAFLDWFFLKLKPSLRKRFPLGYFFVLKK